jgi:hypothetical protein
MYKNDFITKFSKNKPSFYKLTNKQIKQLINYLKFEIKQEELSSAIGYTYTCPYCNSQDIYKMEHKSHLYKFKCEACEKKFTNLSKSVISGLLLEESINRGERFSYKESLKDIEVWLHFDIKHDSYYRDISRENIISNFSSWKYNLLHIPRDLKKEHLINIHEWNEESFYRLLDSKISNTDRKKIRENSNKRFIVLTFQEGEFTPKLSIDDFSKQLMKTNVSSFESYNNDVSKKKAQQYNQWLRDTLIQSYNIKCETLTEPNREDKIYKDIEIPYKHTYSLAYEMAIRNPEVKKILYALNYLKDIKKNVHQNFETNKTFIEKIQDYKETLFLQYLNYMNVELHKEFLSLQFDIMDELINDFEKELRKKYLIVPKENQIKTPESNRIFNQEILYNKADLKKDRNNSNFNQAKYVSEEKISYDYSVAAGIFEGTDMFDVSVIRPTFNSHIIDKNAYLVPINFTLPTEEIVAFIEKIKIDSQKKKDLLKSPMELLGEELEIIESANVEKFLDKSFNGKLKSMADALYAYDTFQYLLREENKLKTEKEKLLDELNTELSSYVKRGRKTKIIQSKEKRINNKYKKSIEDFDKSIHSIGSTDGKKYDNIGRKINLGNSTVSRYIQFMDEYINEEKYKKLFIKTKNKID